MSVLGHIIIAVILSTTISQCKEHAEKIENEAENAEPIKPVSCAKRSDRPNHANISQGHQEMIGYQADQGYPEHAILAGELTPVLLAFRKGVEMKYEALKHGIIKDALDYFRSNGFHSKNRRSVILSTKKLVQNIISSRTRSDADKNANGQFYYPSILVVMEHRNKWPSNEQAQNKLVFRKILYALAYWNEVENQLRRIRNPGVRIRISAIVIGREKFATPYLEKSDIWGYHIHQTLRANLQYWQRARNTFPFAPAVPFNVVATMTDTVPSIFSSYGASVGFTGCGTYFSPRTGNLINMTGLIVYDNQDFASIGRTLSELSYIMGQKPYQRVFADASSMTSEDIMQIRMGLQKASCWKKPLEFYSIGKPAVRLLRWDVDGQL